MTKEKILRISGFIDSKEKDKIRKETELKKEFEIAEKDFDCKSLKEIDEYLNELSKELEKLEDEIETKSKELEKAYDWNF